MSLCPSCGMKMGMADTSMLKRWIAMTAVGFVNRKDRLDDRTEFVCPVCDSYALGLELNPGLPFYYETIGAFVTVSDWDWWNRDPRECDIRQWPDFGCLTFSEESLRGAVAYVRETNSDVLDSATLLPFDSGLVGPTGIPEDEDPESEWGNQLNILHSRMRGEFSKRELDLAVRELIHILASTRCHSRPLRQNQQGSQMSATAKETTNFFWHCLVAARLRDEFPATTATNGHVLRAVRMATLCAAGKDGVQYASDDAQSHRESHGKHWEKCGLIKEHIVPVSLICEQVTKELGSTRDQSQGAMPLLLSDQDRQGLTPEVIELFQQHPRAWVVARIIREWTHLAWITEPENRRFDEKDRHGGISIRKRMPKGWEIGHDRLARYDACDIKVSKI